MLKSQQTKELNNVAESRVSAATATKAVLGNQPSPLPPYFNAAIPTRALLTLSKLFKYIEHSSFRTVFRRIQTFAQPFRDLGLIGVSPLPLTGISSFAIDPTF